MIDLLKFYFYKVYYIRSKDFSKNYKYLKKNIVL